MFKRLLMLLLILLMFPCRLAFGEDPPALTLMVYLCGSNLETQAGAASADLMEMIAHYPAEGKLRVLVMPAGSQAWQNQVDATETAIYELTADGLQKQCALPLQNMGDPAALTTLLQYGYTHAPAQQYALLMWNHGAGPNIGLCFDERFHDENGMDGLTLAELSTALASSPAADTKLSWIGFDACLMATLETASTVAPYAEYMIASQETEPAEGWSYSFLTHILQDASGADTGRRVIDAYFTSQADTMAPIALSLVDLRSIPAIWEEMNRLFDGLHLTLDESSYPAFADCRVNSKSLGVSSSYEYDLVDLVDLLEVYQAEGMTDCTDLLSQLDQAILYSRSNTPYVNGLSVYYPHYGTQDAAAEQSPTGYAAFIADMSAIRLGEPLTDWHQTYQPEATLDEGITRVTMALTQNQADTLDQATLFILKQMSSDDFQPVYRTNDVTLTEDNLLCATYAEQALYIIDSAGNVVSDALPYTLQGDAVVLSGMLYKSDWGADDEDWFLAFRCFFRQDAQGRYRLAEIQEQTTDPTQQGKTTIRLEDYDTIEIFQGSVIPVYGEDGRPLPPSQWTKGTMIYGWYFDLKDFPGWSVDFRTQQDSRNRYALLQITDTQNQVVCSDLLPIANPNITAIPMEPCTLVDNDTCCIRFTEAQEVLGMHPELRLIFTCENRSDQPMNVDVQMLQLNDVLIGRSNARSTTINPGETKSFEAALDRETLERCGIQSVQTLRMHLVANHNYTTQLFEQPAECAFQADLSRIAPTPLTVETLATATWDGLTFDLYDIDFDGTDKLTGKLRIRNTTDAPITLDTAYFYLNDLQLSGRFTDSIVGMTLRGGAVCHTGFQVSLQSFPGSTYRPENSRFLVQALGMTQLHTLGIDVYHTDWQQQSRLTFTLVQPVSLPVQESLTQRQNWPILYDRDGVTVRLADITWEPDSLYQSQYRYINLVVENRTDAPVAFNVPWRLSENDPHTFLVNGQSLAYVHAPSVDANTTSLASIWYTAAEGMDPLAQLDMLLEINGARLQVSIQTLGEARVDGTYYVLDGQQLLLTVTPIN